MSETPSIVDVANDISNRFQNQLIFCVVIAFSLFSQAFTIITYYTIRNKNHKFYAYVAWHSLIGFPWLLSNYPALYFANTNDFNCKLTGFLNTFFHSAYLLWNSVIAWVIFSTIKHGHKIDKIQWQFIPLTYIVSLLLQVPSIMDDKFGPSHGNGLTYCWYHSVEPTYSMMIGFYVPLVASTLFNFYCYGRSAWIARKICTQTTSTQFDGLFIFPFIQGACNSGAILRKIAELLGGQSEKWIILHIILSKGQGMFEALAYFANKSVRNEVRKAWFAPKYHHNKARFVNYVEPPAFDSISIENEVNERLKKLNQPIL